MSPEQSELLFQIFIHLFAFKSQFIFTIQLIAKVHQGLAVIVNHSLVVVHQVGDSHQVSAAKLFITKETLTHKKNTNKYLGVFRPSIFVVILCL